MNNKGTNARHVQDANAQSYPTNFTWTWKLPSDKPKSHPYWTWGRQSHSVLLGELNYLVLEIEIYHRLKSAALLVAMEVTIILASSLLTRDKEFPTIYDNMMSEFSMSEILSHILSSLSCSSRKWASGIFLDHIFVWLSVSKRRLLVPVTKSLRSQVVPYRKCCGTKGLCAYTVYRPLININTPRFTGIPGRSWSQTASRRGVAVRRLVSLRERQRAWSVRAKRESVSQDGLYRCLLERLMKERCASGHYAGGGRRDIENVQQLWNSSCSCERAWVLAQLINPHFKSLAHYNP